MRGLDCLTACHQSPECSLALGLGEQSNSCKANPALLEIDGPDR